MLTVVHFVVVNLQIVGYVVSHIINDISVMNVMEYM